MPVARRGGSLSRRAATRVRARGIGCGDVSVDGSVSCLLGADGEYLPARGSNEGSLCIRFGGLGSRLYHIMTCQPYITQFDYIMTCQPYVTQSESAAMCVCSSVKST